MDSCSIWSIQSLDPLISQVLVFGYVSSGARSPSPATDTQTSPHTQRHMHYGSLQELAVDIRSIRLLAPASPGLLVALWLVTHMQMSL